MQAFKKLNLKYIYTFIQFIAIDDMVLYMFFLCKKFPCYFVSMVNEN